MTTLNMPAGIDTTGTDIEDAKDESETVHLQLDESVEIEIGNTVGNIVYTKPEYFVAMSVDRETDEVEEMATGEEYLDESAVFISNAEGDVGGGIIQLDGGDLQDAIDKFADDYL